MFNLFCPAAIKLNASAQEYAEANLAYYRVVIHTSELDRTVERSLKQMSVWNRSRVDFGADTVAEKLIDNLEFTDPPGPERDAGIIWLVALHWRLLDVSKVGWCLTSCVSYAVGLFALALPAGETFFRVLAVTVRAIGIS